MCLGVPGKIIAISDQKRSMAKVDVGGIVREVSLACIVEEGESPEALVGNWVLIHVGFALSLIDEDEARRTLELIGGLEPDALSR